METFPEHTKFLAGSRMVNMVPSSTSSYFTVLPFGLSVDSIGVRAGGARGAAAPPNFGKLRFFGQHEKIWAKPVFKDVPMFLLLF